MIIFNNNTKNLYIHIFYFLSNEEGAHVYIFLYVLYAMLVNNNVCVLVLMK
jgi:hypothetical protein